MKWVDFISSMVSKNLFGCSGIITLFHNFSVKVLAFMTLCGDPFYYIRTVTSSKNFYIDKFYTKIFISRGVHLPDP